MTVVGNSVKKSSSSENAKQVRPMHYGCIEIDQKFIIKRSLDRTISLILGESALSGKNFLQLLKARVSENSYRRVGHKLLNSIHEKVTYDDKAQKNPLNCIQIQLNKPDEKPCTRYIRIELKKGVSFYKDGCWIMVVHDISKAVRESQKQKRVNASSQPKAGKSERDILNLIQHDRLLVDAFLSDTVISIKELIQHLSTSTPSIDNANDILCLIHQIKDEAKSLNFRAIVLQAQTIENILGLVNSDAKNSAKYFQHLPRAVPPLVKSVNEIQQLYKKLVKGGWQNQQNKVQNNTLAQRVEKLITQLEQEHSKRVLLVNDGYVDNAIPKALRNTINTIVTQLTRNAVAHGIEDSPTRINCSKTSYGCLHISLTKNEKSLSLNIRDDGGGLNAIRIKEAALSCGLFDKLQVHQWNKTQILNALFTPGFSTTKCLNQKEIKGVGLDIIKKHVERHDGNINVRSILGQFTEFSLQFPLQR